jgi:hypothetical protein
MCGCARLGFHRNSLTELATEPSLVLVKESVSRTCEMDAGNYLFLILLRNSETHAGLRAIAWAI